VVPILIVSTVSNVRDVHLSDDITICTFHGVQPHSVVMSSRSTAPMIDTNTAGEFNNTVYNWFDNVD
jgi:hypothetical protein